MPEPKKAKDAKAKEAEATPGGTPPEEVQPGTGETPPAGDAGSGSTSEPQSTSNDDDTGTEDEQPVFTHDRLIQRCSRVIGHPPAVIAGALSKVQKKHLTVEEAKEACDKWVEGS